MKILVVNGPNINMLGIREPKIYGSQSYNQLISYIKEESAKLDIDVKLFQSNHEGEIVDIIQAAYGNVDGIVINPAAYTHTSVAIMDTLNAVSIPAVEVHLSDINTREEFRKISYPGMACVKTFAGYGFESYKMALEFLHEMLSKS